MAALHRQETIIMREEKVKILIKSQQTDIDDPSPYVIEFATDGKIKEDGDTVTIKYDECLEDDASCVAHTSLMFSSLVPGLARSL